MRAGRAGHTLWALVTLSLWISALAAASTPAPPVVAAATLPGSPVQRGPAALHTPSAVAGAPVRLVLAAVALDASLVPVEVGADGRLEVPGHGKTAGWWKDTALPGSHRGATVIAGHLDTRRGAAVFAPLIRAKPGDPITVTTARAGTVAYRISAVTVRRGAALPAEFLSTTGPPRLVLITCTGPYRKGSGYRDRLYVDAAPAARPNQ